MRQILTSVFAALALLIAAGQAHAQDIVEVPAPVGQLSLDNASHLCDATGARLTAEQRAAFLNQEETRAYRKAIGLEIPAYAFAGIGGAFIGWYGMNMILGQGENKMNLSMIGAGAGCILVAALFDLGAKNQKKKIVSSYNGRQEDLTFEWGATPSGLGLSLRF